MSVLYADAGWHCDDALDWFRRGGCWEWCDLCGLCGNLCPVVVEVIGHVEFVGAVQLDCVQSMSLLLYAVFYPLRSVIGRAKQWIQTQLL